MANILVCDDERSICEMLDISLRREGHRVETVQAGQSAKNKIDGALYDVIITDIKMPNIDGIEVLRHAHRVSCCVGMTYSPLVARFRSSLGFAVFSACARTPDAPESTTTRSDKREA